MRCENPVFVKIKDGYLTYQDGKTVTAFSAEVPCGKCFACMSTLRSDWVFRLKQHLRTAQSAFFVTLTYSDEYLPENGSLDKELLKQFFHDFRNGIENDYQHSLPKHLKGKSHHRIKYFAVGEYGDLSLRPHYHFIIFDYRGNNISLMEDIEEFWPYGHIDIRYCSDRLISYITKYLVKSFLDTQALKISNLLEPPFRLVSKGLGLSYVTQARANYLLRGGRPVLSDGNCNRRVPRYYKEKLSKLAALEDNRLHGKPFYGRDFEDVSAKSFQRRIFTKSSMTLADERQEMYDSLHGEDDMKRLENGQQPYYVESYQAYKRNTYKLMNDNKSKL